MRVKSMGAIVVAMLCMPVHASAQQADPVVVQLGEAWRVLKRQDATYPVSQIAGELAAGLLAQGKPELADQLGALAAHQDPGAFEQARAHGLHALSKKVARPSASRTMLSPAHQAGRGDITLTEAQRRIAAMEANARGEATLSLLLGARPGAAYHVQEEAAIAMFHTVSTSHSALSVRTLRALWRASRDHAWPRYTEVLLAHLRSQPGMTTSPGARLMACQMERALGRWERAVPWCPPSLSAVPALATPATLRAPDPFGEDEAFARANASDPWGHYQEIKRHVERHDLPAVKATLDAMESALGAHHKPSSSLHAYAGQRTEPEGVPFVYATLERLLEAGVFREGEGGWVSEVRAHRLWTPAFEVEAMHEVVTKRGGALRGRERQAMVSYLKGLRDVLIEEGAWDWGQRVSVMGLEAAAGLSSQSQKKAWLEEVHERLEQDEAYAKALEVGQVFYAAGQRTWGRRVLEVLCSKLAAQSPPPHVMDEVMKHTGSLLVQMLQGPRPGALAASQMLADLHEVTQAQGGGLRLAFAVGLELPPEVIGAHREVWPLLVHRELWESHAMALTSSVPQAMAMCLRDGMASCHGDFALFVSMLPQAQSKRQAARQFLQAYLLSQGSTESLGRLIDWVVAQDAENSALLVGQLLPMLMLTAHWMPLPASVLGGLEQGISRFDETRGDFELFFRVNHALHGDCEPLGRPLPTAATTADERVPGAGRMLRMGLERCVGKVSRAVALGHIKRLRPVAHQEWVEQEGLLRWMLLAWPTGPQRTREMP